MKTDLDNVKTKSAQWDDIARHLDFTELIGSAIVDTLVDGDGAFKICVDTDLTGYPIVEFIGGRFVEYECNKGIVSAVIFKTNYVLENGQSYQLHEHYGKGFIESILFDANGSKQPLETIPELKDVNPIVTFSGDFMMAVPLMFYRSKKYPGRGKSIFDGGKSDCFDALDEVISQWWDALRAGRVKQYIPEDFIPRNEKDGSLKPINQFGNNYIAINQPPVEGAAKKIEVVQPDIRYEAFLSSYSQALLMCLQGIVSPATLGIDVGKMSSAEAQREKKDVTGNTRNTITGVLEKALPKLISAILKTQDNINGQIPDEHEAEVSFGEYSAPDFDSRVETIGKAATYGVMSIESQVEELWGSSKDDGWKAAEVNRILSEKGLTELPEPSAGAEYDIV